MSTRQGRTTTMAAVPVHYISIRFRYGPRVAIGD